MKLKNNAATSSVVQVHYVSFHSLTANSLKNFQFLSKSDSLTESQFSSNVAKSTTFRHLPVSANDRHLPSSVHVENVFQSNCPLMQGCITPPTIILRQIIKHVSFNPCLLKLHWISLTSMFIPTSRIRNSHVKFSFLSS